MFEGKTVAAIVPAYREKRLIGRMLRRVPALVDAIYVVDDASNDGTAQVARAVADTRVRCLCHEQNLGVGAAIVTGYRAALERGADILVVMAGDDQMDPADLPALLQPVAEGQADYVKGNRFRHADLGRMPLLRRIGGRLLSWLTRRFSGLNIDDTQCGYTALSRRAAESLPLEELWPRYGYPNDLLLMLAGRGLRVSDVAVRPIYADEASGVRPWHLLTVASVIVRRSLRQRGARALPAPSVTPALD